MKKCFCIIIAVIIVMVMLFCMVVHVPNPNPNESKQKEESMFVIIEISNIGKVVYQKETKVMYVARPYGGFELLVNADGSPMIYGGE